MKGRSPKYTLRSSNRKVLDCGSEERAAAFAVREPRSANFQSAVSADELSLSPRERAGVRGNFASESPIAPVPNCGSWRGGREGKKASKSSTAFTLIELMIAVALMTLIVFGLLAMFTQTQRAFRASMTQTDVLESGRIFTDMSIREMGQMAPSGLYSTTNFFAELSPFFSIPLLQGLPGTTRGPGTEDRRTNLVERMFFLNLVNQTWTGTGYEVLPDYANAGVGTLYRFSVSTNGYWVNQMSSNFLTGVRFAAANLGQGKPVTNLNRMLDGVVHFRVRAFATNGYPILYDGLRTNAIFRTNSFYNGYLRLRNAAAAIPLASVPDQVNCYFMSNALPAYLELEVGILEPHILERFKAIGGPTMPPAAALQAAQRRYLSNHVAQVHLFRQRIPIRTVDFSAYQ